MAGFLLFPTAIAVGVLVGQVAGGQRGWIAGLFAGTLVMLIRISWPLRAKLWFWVVVAAFAVVDILAIELVDWSFTEKWNGHSFSGFGVLDLGAMMAIVYGLYRLNYGPPPDAIREDPEDLPAYANRNLDL